MILLESTWNDPSPHVWGKSVKEWISLFSKCDLVFSETHYYVYLLRVLWYMPFLNNLPFSGILEDVIVALSYPLEFGLMKINFAKVNRGGLQHLLIFRKV